MLRTLKLIPLFLPSLFLLQSVFAQTPASLAPATISPLVENTRQVTGTVPYTAGTFSVKLSGVAFDCADSSSAPKCRVAATGAFTIDLDRPLVPGQIVEIVFTPKNGEALAAVTARVPGQFAIGTFSKLALRAGGDQVSGIAPYPYGALSVMVDGKEICDSPDKCPIDSGNGTFDAHLSTALVKGQKVVVTLTPNQGAPVTSKMTVQPPSDPSEEAKTCESVVQKVIVGKPFTSPDLLDLAHCSSLVLHAVQQLQEDLSVANYDTATFTTAAGAPAQFRADPVQVEFQDNLYFGWRKNDAVRDTLIRFHSSLDRLIDKSNSRRLARKHPMDLIAMGTPKLSLDFATAFAAPKNSCSSVEVDLQKVDANLLRNLCAQTYTTQVVSTLMVAQQGLQTIMEDQGLTEPFAALLETYFVPFSAAGSNGVPSALTATNQKNQTFAAGFLSFESDHFRAPNIPFSSLSFGGRIGISPRETLVTVNGLMDSSGNPDTRPRAYLQNAFNWQLDTRGNFALGRRSEASLLFAWGQNILIADTNAVGPAAPNTTTLYGNTQSGAWFWESGVGYRIYPYDLQRVRDEKKFLLPSFSLSTGFRRDSRFAGLEQAQLGSFSNPEQRWFLRSFVTLTNVFERNQSGNNNSGLFNVGIGFDYETVWGFGAGGERGRLTVPNSSRIYLNASIDLVGALGKQGSH